MIIYVNCNAAPGGCGTKEQPFARLQQAAEIAQPGDTVLAAPGIYREDVSPIRSGREDAPIVFRSSEPLSAVITGAEKADTWEHFRGDVWKLTIPNSRFGSYNPYTTPVSGDWLSAGKLCHTGEVFLNGKSLYEQTSLTDVLEPEYNMTSWNWQFTKHTWYTCQSPSGNETQIFANFQGLNPNEQEVEISMRSHCFYPRQEHVDYITLDGFTVTMAATQWAPPTALQEGMIGPHWSKGWVIENCEVSLSKCSGISLGKYYQPGNDNKWLLRKTKDGTQTQRDCCLIAQLDGWSKETIGSHTVRSCNIHHCGQTGIVGNLGCVFSLIENNHIHHINNKGNLNGAEIGGIKFHAALDVIIRGNHFHHCTRGVWLDWQTQGTRVTGNLFHHNCLPEDHLLESGNQGLAMGEDLFIEIGHGPTLVDNNILLSERAVKLPTQGTAFVHNLIAGAITGIGRGVKNGTVKYDSTRYTPIHRPHDTGITGFMSVLHGDNRFYNNIFYQSSIRPELQKICDANRDSEWDDCNLKVGTCVFRGFMTETEWNSCFEGYCGEGCTQTRDRYYMPLPVWTGGNVFLNGAQPWEKEKDAMVITDRSFRMELKEKGGSFYLDTDFMDILPQVHILDSEALGIAFEPEQKFEDPNGQIIRFDTDYLGNSREAAPAGPFAGNCQQAIWPLPV